MKYEQTYAKTSESRPPFITTTIHSSDKEEILDHLTKAYDLIDVDRKVSPEELTFAVSHIQNAMSLVEELPEKGPGPITMAIIVSTSILLIGLSITVVISLVQFALFPN